MRGIEILVVEDDDDYYRLLKKVMIGIVGAERFHRVGDGEELFLFLNRQGRYSGTDPHTPKLIILDLHMPKLNGIQALKKIRSEGLSVPVVIMTSSTEVEDVERSYRLGANSYILKGRSLSSLETKLRALCSYWLETVEIPPWRLND